MIMTMQGPHNQLFDNNQDLNFQNQNEIAIQRLERDVEQRLEFMEQKINSLDKSLIQKVSKIEERQFLGERSQSNQLDALDKLRAYQEKLERKLKETVEQNVEIKI